MSNRKRIDKERIQVKKSDDKTGGKGIISPRKMMFKRVNDGIVVLDNEGKVVFINQKASDLEHGFSAEEIIKTNAWNQYIEKAGRDFRNACEEAVETRKPFFFEEYYQPWNCFVRSRIYPSEEGLTIYFSDITDYKSIEKELKDNLNLIEESQEIAHLGNWYLDIPSEEFQWSDEMYRIFGQMKDNFSPTIETFKQLVHTDDREALDIWFDQSLAGVKPGALEFRIVTPQGKIRWIRGDGRLTSDQKGEANKMIGFVLDITERRTAQKDIEGIIKSSPVIIFILNIKEDYPAYLQYGMKNCLGYSDEQIEAMNGNYTKALLPPEFIKTYRDTIQKKYPSLKDGEAIEYECQLKNSKGKWLYFLSKEFVFSRNPNGTPAQIIGFSMDITNKKNVEIEMKQDQAFIEKVINAFPNIVFIYDIEKDAPVFTNLGTGKFLGYSEEEVKSMGVDLNNKIMHPDDAARFKITNQAAYPTLKDDDVLEFNSRLRTKSGEWRNFYSKEYVFSRNSDGSVAQIFGIVTDVTERKKQEEEIKKAQQLLEDSEERYRLLVDSSPYAVGVVQREKIVFVNPTAIQILGGKDESDLIGKHVSKLFTLEKWETLNDRITRMLKGEKGLFPFEEQIVRLDGLVITVDLTISPVIFGGQPAVQIIALDITEKRRTEMELANEAIRRKYLIDKSKDGIVTIDSHGNVIEGNLRAAEIVGCTQEELTHLNVLEMGADSPMEKLSKILNSVNEEGDTFETTHTRKDGSKLELEVSSNQTVFKGEKLIFSVVRDITERKKAERKLADEALRRRLLIEQSRDGIVVIDQNGKVCESNLRFAEMLGYTPEEVLDLHVWDWDASHSKKELLKMTRDVDEKGDHFETEHKRKDGSVFAVEISSNGAIFGKEKRVFCVCRDINQRKIAQSNLQKTLDDLRHAVGTTIDVLVHATEIRDPYTAGHQKRVADLARAIATEMELPVDRIQALRMAASIHDIGKISIPSEILSKPSRLTEVEYAIVKEHPRYGMEILKNVSSHWPLAEIVYQHHEKMDGSGYPQGLKGEEIMLEARILCVADVVEAMASHRPYRPSKGIEAALEEIEKQKGILFDEQVVDACIKLFREKRFSF